MTSKSKRYPAEVREHAVRLVRGSAGGLYLLQPDGTLESAVSHQYRGVYAGLRLAAPVPAGYAMTAARGGIGSADGGVCCAWSWAAHRSAHGHDGKDRRITPGRLCREKRLPSANISAGKIGVVAPAPERSSSAMIVELESDQDLSVAAICAKSLPGAEPVRLVKLPGKKCAQARSTSKCPPACQMMRASVSWPPWLPLRPAA